jgi:LysR family transcriptional regulator, benzoate and cis,cis-muconate-responsive activator of ben and cat genes
VFQCTVRSTLLDAETSHSWPESRPVLEHAVLIGARDIRSHERRGVLWITHDLQHIPVLNCPAIGVHLEDDDIGDAGVVRVIAEEVEEVDVSEDVIADCSRTFLSISRSNAGFTSASTFRCSGRIYRKPLVCVKYFVGLKPIPKRYTHGMELRHLRYFVAVAEEQSITRAAARLYISQPPLSRQIRDLENELGVKLFDRSARAIRLTETGQIFLHEARSVLQRTDEATDSIKAFALGKRGRINIGYAAPSTVELLTRILRLFRETHPQIGVHLVELTQRGLAQALRERSIDAALIVSISPKDFAGFTVKELRSYPVRVVFDRKHRFAKMREVPLSELADEPIVTLSSKENPEARAGLLKILAPVTKTPNIVEEYDDVMSRIAAVVAGRGVTLDFQSLEAVAGQRLLFRPLKPSPPPLPIAIAYRPDGLSKATAAFIGAARAIKTKPSVEPVLRA